MCNKAKKIQWISVIECTHRQVATGRPAEGRHWYADGRATLGKHARRLVAVGLLQQLALVLRICTHSNNNLKSEPVCKLYLSTNKINKMELGKSISNKIIFPQMKTRMKGILKNDLIPL